MVAKNLDISNNIVSAFNLLPHADRFNECVVNPTLKMNMYRHDPMGAQRRQPLTWHCCKHLFISFSLTIAF
jgi:hypothetical protein